VARIKALKEFDHEAFIPKNLVENDNM